MSKKIMNAILMILLILLTFFGLGPVLYADGTDRERMLTLLVVIVIYIVIFVIFYVVNKRMRK